MYCLESKVKTKTHSFASWICSEKVSCLFMPKSRVSQPDGKNASFNQIQWTKVYSPQFTWDSLQIS